MSDDNREHLEMMDKINPIETKFDLVIRRIEESFFSFLIIVLIIIGLIPIIMRFLGEYSHSLTTFLLSMVPKGSYSTFQDILTFDWTETLSQQVVLWTAFLGAGTAVRQRSSISIDALPQFLSPRKRLLLRAITEIVGGVICGILIKVSWAFLSDKLEYEKDAIAFLNIPEWWFATILPLGFFVLTLRMIIAAIEDIIMFIKFNNDGIKKSPLDNNSKEEVE